MTDNKAVMQLALEALEVASTPLAKDRQKVLRAMGALRAAIAQPEQPAPLPVALEPPHGWVLIPNDPATPKPDYAECARQADVATGLPTQYPSAWMSIFIREINRWCQHARQEAAIAQPTIKKSLTVQTIAQPEQTRTFELVTYAQKLEMFRKANDKTAIEYESYIQAIEDYESFLKSNLAIAQPKDKPAVGNIADLPELQKAIREKLANGTLQVQGAQPEQTAPRGTDAQILKEREITTSAIVGAMAYGFQNGEYPPDDSAWLRPFWTMGRRDAEREALIAQPEQTVDPVAWMLPSDEGHDSAYRDASTVKMSKATGATHWDSGDWIPLYTSPQVAQPEQQTERNFCTRCGKRLAGDGVHTCTPPKAKK